MAFCANLPSILNSKLINKKLFLKRTDKELALQSFNFFPSQSLDVLDWPTFENKMKVFLIDLIAFISQICFKLAFMKRFMNHKTGFLPLSVRDKHIADGINLISKYPEVFTDRLHGCILAVLLNKKVVLIDNSYGKNSEFYNAWMKNFENVSLLIN